MAELPGGHVTPVVRVGDTVRRTPSASAAFVHRLLRHLEAEGFSGAPRFLGFDDAGREILSFLEGHVAWDQPQPAEVSSDASLQAAARLVRAFHDYTAGTDLAGEAEVVCHNDLSPRNTVYRDLGAGLVPVAFIDWDIAAPGERIHDVAHVCWQFLDLGPAIADPVDAARRMTLICDAYGLGDRSAVVDTVLWWQDRCWRGIDAKAEAGDPAMLALRQAGVPAGIREAYEWVRDHREALAVRC
jgi:phosphotransferase family enzyme